MGNLLGRKTGKGSKSVAPHSIDVIAQFREALGVQAEVVAGSATLFFQQARGLEDLQVLRYGRPAYWKLAGQFTDRRRAAAQQIDDGLAGGVGERAEHLRSVSHTLR
jgi:hypothetical protein